MLDEETLIMLDAVNDLRRILSSIKENIHVVSEGDLDAMEYDLKLLDEYKKVITLK